MEMKYGYGKCDVEEKTENARVLKAYADRIIALADKEKTENKEEE